MLHPVVLQADETLARFLDFCTYGHMIDNVVLIVTGTLHERDVQVRTHLSARHDVNLQQCTHTHMYLYVCMSVW